MNETHSKQKSSNQTQHQVYFIGAGPGDPELITVKGQRLLRQADVVIYTGSLVPEVVISGLHAELHNSAGLNLDEVFEIIYSSWEKGKRVVINSSFIIFICIPGIIDYLRLKVHHDKWAHL